MSEFRGYDFEFRLERAKEHIQLLNTELGWWLKSDPYRFLYKYDRERGEYVAWVEELSRPPVKLGIIIGDCLHNLRSALDNLAYSLLCAHTRRPSSDRKTKSAFPIVGGGGIRPDKWDEMVGGIAPEAQTRIDCLQPYKRGDSYKTDPLWILNRLSNIDKHRLIHLPAVTSIKSDLRGLDPDVLRQTDLRVGVPVEDGTIVARIPGDILPNEEVKVNLNFSIEVVFPEGTVVSGQRIVTALNRLRDHITDKVVSPLAPYLD